MSEEIDSLIEMQKEKLLELAQLYRPYLGPEDLLQPNDYPELEDNPLFRYEEGILAGMQMIKSALQSQKKW